MRTLEVGERSRDLAIGSICRTTGEEQVSLELWVLYVAGFLHGALNQRSPHFNLP